jgi:hypothetical protein
MKSYWTQSCCKAWTLALLFVVLVSVSWGAYAMGPNNCGAISQAGDCLTTNTCACIAAGTTLQITPPLLSVYQLPGQATDATLNPACSEVTNHTNQDAVVFFEYASEWNLKYPSSLFANTQTLSDAGLSAKDCDRYSYTNANYAPCTATCGGGTCQEPLITTPGPQNWQCQQTDRSAVPPTTTTVAQSYCINAKPAISLPAPSHTYTNNAVCDTGSWTAGGCSATCGGGTIQAPTCSGGDGQCDPSTMPAYGQACNTQSCDTGSWVAGTCSATCGGGTILPPTCSGGDGLCDPSTKPASGQSCNTQACPQNGQCGSAQGTASGTVDFNYGGTQGVFQTPSPAASTLCAAGVATTPSSSNGVWSWSCLGGDGSSSASNASCYTLPYCPGNNVMTDTMISYSPNGSVGSVAFEFQSCCGTVCSTTQGPVVSFGQGGITGCSGSGGPDPCPH